MWELFPSIVGKVMRRRCACGRSVGGELCWRSCGGSYVSFMSLIHSQKCSICYSVACFSECVAEVVFVVQSRSNTLSVITSNPHKRYSVCTCTVWLGRSLLYQSLFDSVLIMDFNNIATCLGMTFLYWGMRKVTPHFGCSSAADVYRYITA